RLTTDVSLVFHRTLTVAWPVPLVQLRLPPPLPVKVPPVTPPPTHFENERRVRIFWFCSLNVRPGRNLITAFMWQEVDCWAGQAWAHAAPATERPAMEASMTPAIRSRMNTDVRVFILGPSLARGPPKLPGEASGS